MTEYELLKGYIQLQLNKQRIQSELSDNTLIINCRTTSGCLCTALNIVKEMITENDLVVVDRKQDLKDFDLTKIDYVINRVKSNLNKKNYDKLFVLSDEIVLDTKLCYNTIIKM